VATPTGMAQVTGGKFQDLEGAPLANGILLIELSHDSNLGSVPEQVVAGLKRTVTLDLNGNIPSNPPTYLFINSLLTPAGSYYIVRGFKADGTNAFGPQYWIITTDPTDVGTLIPNNPPGGVPIVAAATRVASFNFQVDGGGSAITTGAKGQWDVPVACTITGWVLTADQSGSCVIDVLRSTYAGFPSTSSIASTDKPTLSSAQKNENLAVSVWTTALAANDQLQINVNSATTVTRVNLNVLVTIP
jgi:hypothetical protein